MRRIRKLFNAYFFENKMILAGLTSQKKYCTLKRIFTDKYGYDGRTGNLILVFLFIRKWFELSNLCFFLNSF